MNSEQFMLRRMIAMAGLREVRASINGRITPGQGQQQWLGYTRSGREAIIRLQEVRASSNGWITPGQGQQQWLDYTRSGPAAMAGLHEVRERSNN